MLDILALATTEHIGIEHNDASRHLISSCQHLWRLIWDGCFNLGRMDIQESMYCLPMLKSRQRQTSVKLMCTVSLTTFLSYFNSLLTLFLVSGLRNVMVHHISTDTYVCAALIRQGLMPCAPYSPTAVITIRALELFHLTHLHCPHVSIHSFMKTLCDMHCVPFKPYLLHQFTIAFDLYLSI